ncbi:hypothetical protein [Haloarcula salinisoli]|uniref:Uncharacterized protein n=1 Tax=Haloarcula salinisoli TaxID=2487746 RepID=A0A8J7YM26_9EURY|nr:hypothetical protein [Halomicroarcula salinisoli]MBX0305284.1 hypothetical protein [Halomicroarcula salinisoli]
MDETPAFEFDPQESMIYIDHEGSRINFYSEATRKEYAVVSDIDELANDGSRLSRDIAQLLMERQQLSSANQSGDRLQRLQQRVGKQYEQCQRFQEIAQTGRSKIVEEQLPILYKHEKLIKHALRQLAAAQSLGFSVQMLVTYLDSREVGYCYGFIRNVCSTVEYLGKHLEGRAGAGDLSTDEHDSFKTVYQTLVEQKIPTNYVEDEQVVLPPESTTIPLSEVPLNDAEIDWLRKRRNQIVHHCPLIVSEATLSTLNDAVRSTTLITESERDRALKLAARLHLHTTTMLLNFMETYEQDLIEATIDVWYNDASEIGTDDDND